MPRRKAPRKAPIPRQEPVADKGESDTSARSSHIGEAKPFAEPEGYR